jgi:hypothetical protein
MLETTRKSARKSAGVGSAMASQAVPQVPGAPAPNPAKPELTTSKTKMPENIVDAPVLSAVDERLVVAFNGAEGVSGCGCAKKRFGWGWGGCERKPLDGQLRQVLGTAFGPTSTNPQLPLEKKSKTTLDEPWIWRVDETLTA